MPEPDAAALVAQTSPPTSTRISNIHGQNFESLSGMPAAGGPMKGDGPTTGDAALVARVRDSLPVHYFDCDRFEVYNYGLRQGTCDCTATADVEALLTQAEASATAGDGR